MTLQEQMERQILGTLEPIGIYLGITNFSVLPRKTQSLLELHGFNKSGKPCTLKIEVTQDKD